MFVHGSMQCAYYVHGAVMRALNCGPADVHVHQDVTGGGFGGKEAFPSILGCQVAVAAKKVRQARPLRLRPPGGSGVYLQAPSVPVHLQGGREGWPGHRYGH